MSKIFVSGELFNLKSRSSAGILKFVEESNKRGHELLADNLPEFISRFISLEGIGIAVSDRALADSSISLKDGVLSCSDGEEYKDFYDLLEKSVLFSRTAQITRKTRETEIFVNVNLDGSGKSNIQTGIGFFDHMLDQISRHANIDLDLKTTGDLHVDEHHTVEDTGIALGEVIKSALGNKLGIKRYGFVLPMDDSTATVAIDFGGRPYLKFNSDFKREKVGDFPTELVEEFFRGFTNSALVNLHISCEGTNDHHKIESIFKGFAKCINEACRLDERVAGLPSTKGLL
ncbi:MAG: hypothetical protein SCALA702_31370 [Melioribacteraceae bacterium]|nr:MAG: hypothetical protein SCALA702_31370 [Melioribacteraceae bacterium]